MLLWLEIQTPVPIPYRLEYTGCIDFYSKGEILEIIKSVQNILKNKMGVGDPFDSIC